ncbi:MAG: Txe/YoeB family addiction module toxin [Bacteroidales bacterium]|jgi:toxin YoeB|nr:Txe/YoeB family addiction module toxin [Bacteroidales bacterium]
MAYTIDFSDSAREGIARLKKSEPAAHKKLDKLIAELEDHPYTGTGHPERLKGGYYAECYSRRISEKHRLIYQINDDIVVVHVLAAYGHYNDK